MCSTIVISDDSSLSHAHQDEAPVNGLHNDTPVVNGNVPHDSPSTEAVEEAPITPQMAEKDNATEVVDDTGGGDVANDTGIGDDNPDEKTGDNESEPDEMTNGYTAQPDATDTEVANNTQNIEITREDSPEEVLESPIKATVAENESVPRETHFDSSPIPEIFVSCEQDTTTNSVPCSPGEEQRLICPDTSEEVRQEEQPAEEPEVDDDVGHVDFIVGK